MSGTSLDGIDVALLVTDGEDIVERGPSATCAYDEAQRHVLRQAIADAVTMTDRKMRPGSLVEAERALTHWHAQAVAAFRVRHHQGPIDLIGFHGQTVIHRPEIGLTVQLGDGPALARATQTPVVYDLRAADVAAVGQGAPLVPVYHRALASSLKDRPIAFLNIGGVANVTWIGKDGELLAFDTGPGNALLNDWCEKRIGRPFDEGGQLAARGKIDDMTLQQLLGDSYFEEQPPKSLDRNSFAGLKLDHLSDADGAATLLAFTCRSILKATDWFPTPPDAWIVCGGGRKNVALMQGLPGFLTAEEASFDGDAMEAEAWAYLAVRSKRGLPITFPGTTRAPVPLTGGVLALPK
jgi:anhydro-N-acetylmuramic acid kinase